MIILLSPTKTQSESLSVNHLGSTRPAALNKTHYLIRQLKQLSLTQLTAMMKLSGALAKKTHHMIQHFSETALNDSTQALYLFQGDAFQKFDAASLDKKSLAFAQNHLVILSALYGYLKPLDAVQPYRLDMQDRLDIPNEKSLSHYWRDTVTDGLNDLLLQQKNNYMLNLASSEYFSVIDLKKIAGKIIHVDFKVKKNDTLKSIPIYAKRGRGLLARYLIDHAIDSPEDMMDFRGEGFRYSHTESMAGNCVRHIFILTI